MGPMVIALETMVGPMVRAVDFGGSFGWGYGFSQWFKHTVLHIHFCGDLIGSLAPRGQVLTETWSEH